MIAWHYPAELEEIVRKLPVILLLAALCLAQSGTRNGIDRSMFDTSCKPCDDFWRYATGTWVDQHPIPADRARWGKFDELAEANLERLKTILDATAADRSATGGPAHPSGRREQRLRRFPRRHAIRA